MFDIITIPSELISLENPNKMPFSYSSMTWATLPEEVKINCNDEVYTW